KINNFLVIILGDFNIDPFDYLEKYNHSLSIPPYYDLLQYLYDSNFIEIYPKNSMDLEFATHYCDHIPKSRIDQIWFDRQLMIKDYCFTQTWTLPCTLLSTDARYKLDHKCVINYFTKHLLIPSIPKSRLKKKKEWRKIYDTKNAGEENWTDYRRF